jgi:KAP family P-loop domain
VKKKFQRAFYVLQRWTNIGSYALFGSAFAAYCGPFLANWTERRLSAIPGGDSPVFVCILIGILAIALWQCNRLAGTQWNHLRWLLLYPPLPVAVILSFLFAPLWPAVSDREQVGSPIAWYYAGILSLSYAFLWLIQTVLEHIAQVIRVRILEKEMPPSSEGRTLDKLTNEDLRDWLNTELPIADERRDLFRAAEISERLLRRLDDGKNSIALQGAYGVGKTSIIQMAERRAYRKNRRFWFVKVSCWGFDNSAVIQREVLDQLVQRVGKRIDCFAIRGLPRNYVDAIAKDIGWLGIFKVLVSRHLSPLEQLQRFTPILGAAAHTVVVVIEDVDRNGRGFDLGDIQALLARFREVKGVSFVLSISTEQQIDFARLCEFVDVVPTLDEEQVLKIVHRVRAMCLDKFDDLLPDGVEQITADDDRYKVSSLFFTNFRLWAIALTNLLATPRALKFTLRRVTAVWEQMHGEVNIDLLLMASALRATASPVFSFLVENYTRIRQARDSRDSQYSLESEREKPVRQLKAEWEKLVTTEQFDVRNASVLMLHLLPEASIIIEANTNLSEKRQGLSGQRGTVYARRLFSEALGPSEVRDQTILKLMKAADDKAGLVGTCRDSRRIERR